MSTAASKLGRSRRGFPPGATWASAVLVMACILLTGCTTTGDPKTYVGKTLDVAYKEIASPTVVDLTAQVTGQPTDPDTPPPPSRWLIVASCAREVSQHQYVDLGIIPKSMATTEIRRHAKNGAYDRYVDSCSARTPAPK